MVKFGSLEKMVGEHSHSKKKKKIEVAAKEQVESFISQSDCWEWKELWVSNLKNKVEKELYILIG